MDETKPLTASDWRALDAIVPGDKTLLERGERIADVIIGADLYHRLVSAARAAQPPQGQAEDMREPAAKIVADAEHYLSFAPANHAERLSAEDLNLTASALSEWAWDHLSRGYGCSFTVREVSRLIAAVRETTIAHLRAELEQVKRERDEAYRDMQTAISMLSEHVEQFHDYKDESGASSDERNALRHISHHLEGSLISDEGEYRLAHPSAEGGLREALHDAFRALRRARWAYETIGKPSPAWVELDAAFQRAKAALSSQEGRK